RYPGNMTNEKEDMMEQDLDAEFALNHLKNSPLLLAEPDRIGVLACIWGGMSAATLINRNRDIKSFVSFDGTETHYFGGEDENDRFIQEIYDSRLVAPESQSVSYLYFESGDKLDEFQAVDTYNYFEKLNSEKYYLRFTNSEHADFTCIPSILSASEPSVQVYSDLSKATVAFFRQTLRKEDGFAETWQDLKSQENTSVVPFEIPDSTETFKEISGKVTDAETGKTLPYVNIGILNRERGTVTDIEGRFVLEFPEEFGKDTLRISSIGYQTIDLLIRNLRDQPSVSVALKEDIGELDEIVISAKGLKKKTLGNETQSRFMSTGFSYDQLGAEMGIKIKIRNQPTYVDAFNFFVSHNRLSASSVFRVNFYSVENGKPGKNLLKNNILVRIDPKETGPITVDLQNQNIVLTDDVIVTLEWVDSEGLNNKGEAIFFSLALLNSGTIYKKSSQSPFKKYSNLGVGFNINARY
ncbi:MAG: carboxypeptidase-like regulatory domain-containing protein, partial [Lutimonas sp.]